MKKSLIALTMALALTMGMSTAAMAAEPQYVDVDTIQLSEIYKLVNGGTTNPAEEFTYSITNYSVSDSSYTLDTMPSFAEENYTIAFAEGEATTAGNKKSTEIDLPEYESVGVFTYLVQQQAGSTAGVTYDEKPVYLKVTVLDQDGELCRVVAYHYSSPSGTKTEVGRTQYRAGSLVISKEVQGNMGDKNKNFDVDVVFTKPAGKDVKGSITYVENGQQKMIAPEDWSEDGTATRTIKVKDGSSVAFLNIPYAVTYEVTEHDYTGEGYEEAVYSFSDEDRVIHQSTDTVEILNNKATTVDTGVYTDVFPYVAMLGVAVMGLALVLGRRRDYGAIH